MNQFPRHAAFAAGLAVVAWVGAGYLLTNPLALVITVLIGALYLAGVLELHRFRGATTELATAVGELPESLTGLRAFLDRVPASLQNSVRRRIEGEPVGLPGPSLAPTLAGLLVLLGMLGTFLGMILTLRGTGAALETATDLVAVRNSLIAPVKGLGLAFGTSVAGVAASASLGLLAALARRERVAVTQRLDARIATTLRPFSVAHQRETSLALLQRQADLMPALVDSLKTMMDTLAEQAESANARLATQSEAANARLLASQERFQGQAEAAYTGLAASVDRTLQASLTEGARIAGETIRPVAEATLAGIARETSALHAALAGTMQGQLDQLSTRFEASAAGVAESWQALLARHARAGDDLAATLAASHERFAQTFEARSASLLGDVAARHQGWQGEMAQALAGMARETAATRAAMAEAVAAQVDGVGTRLDVAVERVTAAWAQAVAQHETANARMSITTSDALAAAAGSFEQHSASLLRTVEQAHAELRTQSDDRDQQRTAALAAVASGFEQQSALLLRTVEQAHAELQTQSAARDQQRVDAMAKSLEAMAESLRQQWQQAGAQSLEQQQRVVETMERTARDITGQAQTQARATIAEIGRLVQAASEAPRAAAEVISELRQKLEDSMARDNTMLDERARILETLGTLLDGINQAAREQRGAIDALVSSSAEVLERVGARFHEQVQGETGKLVDVAAQITGGAAEVASLGEAFGAAVQVFGESGEKLGAHLERVDVALNAQMARSDEQLAYYVAQAREVIDLSILSQKQIIEELQRLAGRRAAEAVA